MTITRSTAAALLAAATLAATTRPASAEPAGATPAVEDDRPTRRAAPRAPRRHGRMLLESGAMLAIGTAWYWRSADGRLGGANVVDWQLGFEGRALGAKLGMTRDGWRFDGNSYGLNALGHPMFGALTYFSARKNRYGVGESFVVSTLASGAWELFTEWAEYGSINDMLSTSTTGVALGETGYQLMNHWREAQYAVTAGAGAEAGAAFGSLGLGVALDTSPRHGAGVIGGGRKVAASVEIAHDGAVRSVEGDARSSLVGYHRAGDGAAWFAGLSTGFTYRDRKDRADRPWDLMTTVGVGPAVEARVERGGATVTVGLDVQAQFAMARAQGHDAWRSMNPAAVVRNSMQDKARPYYYAGALAVEPRVAVRYRGLDVGGVVVARALDSLDGADRDQEMLTADPHITDTDVTARAWAGYQRRGVRLAVDGRIRHRAGTMGGAHGETTDRTTMLTLSVQR
jgi:hypothetical protein